MSPREILLQREWCYDKKDKSVVVRYHSVEDDRVPIRPGNVRSISPHTLWRFQDSSKVAGPLHDALDIARRGKSHAMTSNCAQIISSSQEEEEKKSKRRGWAIFGGRKSIEKNGGAGCTVLEIECVVDPRGSIPAWFINYMQRMWPSQALASYERIIRKNIVKPMEKIRSW